MPAHRCQYQFFSFFIKFPPDALVPEEVMHLPFPPFFNTMQPPMILLPNSIVIFFYFIFMFGKRAQQRRQGADAFLVPPFIYLMPPPTMPLPNSASLFSNFPNDNDNKYTMPLPMMPPLEQSVSFLFYILCSTNAPDIVDEEVIPPSFPRPPLAADVSTSPFFI